MKIFGFEVLKTDIIEKLFFLQITKSLHHVKKQKNLLMTIYRNFLTKYFLLISIVKVPTIGPTNMPTFVPTLLPTLVSTNFPTNLPTTKPTCCRPTNTPTIRPTVTPTSVPTTNPTTEIRFLMNITGVSYEVFTQGQNQFTIYLKDELNLGKNNYKIEVVCDTSKFLHKCTEIFLKQSFCKRTFLYYAMYEFDFWNLL